MEFKQTAIIILQEESKPLTAKEITVKALSQGILTTSGKTPAATMAAEIYKDIKRKGTDSDFVKAGKGLFALKEVTGTIKASEEIYSYSFGYKQIIEDLKESQFKSDSPTDFEKAILNAFVFLGFEGELIGGSGNTDVVLTANIGKISYKITVDGKTSKSGKIIDRAIDWLSLSDHKKKNEADYIVVVGSSFAGGNLINRANEHEVTLIKTDDLIRLIYAHASFPLTLTELRDLFSGKGDLSSQLEDSLAQNSSRRNLLEQFRIIIEEMQSLQDRLGYFTFDSLAGREKIEDLQIEPNDIEYIITLLRLPFINGIHELTPGKYVLAVRIKDIANIFQQISNLLAPNENNGSRQQEEDVDLVEIERPKKKIPPQRNFGSKYFNWYQSGHSIIAEARRENPYKHHCPLNHFETIINTIAQAFNEHNLVSADLIFTLLEGKELSPNRIFKGKPEDYKIRMALGILEIEGLLKWTGSKRPIEYTIVNSGEEILHWFKNTSI